MRKVCRHQAAAFRVEFQLALGIVVGRFGLRRVAGSHASTYASHWRFVAHDAWRRRDCVFSATAKNTSNWKQAAQRESLRYGIGPDYVEARMQERRWLGSTTSTGLVDWGPVRSPCGCCLFAAMARAPGIRKSLGSRVAVLASQHVLWFGG